MCRVQSCCQNTCKLLCSLSRSQWATTLLLDRAALLTSHFPLLILSALKHRVRDPHPGVVLAELREQVMRDEAHSACQGKQHHTEKWLQKKRARSCYVAQKARQRHPRVTHNTSTSSGPLFPVPGMSQGLCTELHFQTSVFETGSH